MCLDGRLEKQNCGGKKRSKFARKLQICGESFQGGEVLKRKSR